MQYKVIMYDIEDNQLRLKVSNILGEYGLIRIQKSVFCGSLTQSQWMTCQQEVEEKFLEKKGPEDRIYWLSSSKNQLEGMQVFGTFPEKSSILESVIVLHI